MRRQFTGSSSSWAPIAATVLLTVVATRLLPPVLSQARGRFGSADPFARFADDHRRILALLERMEQAQGRAARGASFLRLKRMLSAHALAEEDVVYPLMRESLGEEEAVSRFYADHGAIKIDLYALETLIDSPRWPDRVRALRERIADHAREEEEVEFPRLQRGLSAEERAIAAGKIARERALLL